MLKGYYSLFQTCLSRIFLFCPKGVGSLSSERQELVVEFFSKQYLRCVTNSFRRPDGYQEHFAMINALEKGDAAELSALIRSHINDYIECYTQNKDE